MGTHAKLAPPSSAERWMACPGSAAMIADLVDPSSEAADEGTAAHLVYNLCLEHDSEPDDYLGTFVHVGHNPKSDFDGAVIVPPEGFQTRRIFEVDETMVALLKTAVENTRGLLEGSLFRAYERALPMDDATGETGETGTADVMAVNFGNTPFGEGVFIDIHDLKFGRKEVLPSSKQLKIYGVAGLDSAASLIPGDPIAVRLAVHQPKLHDTPLVEWLSIEEAEAFRKEAKACFASVFRAYEERGKWVGTSAENEYLVPGEAQCQWCPASGGCSVQAARVEAVVGAKFLDMTNDEAVIRSVPSTPELLAQGMRALAFVEQWCKAVSERAYAQAMTGTPPDGFKLVLGRKGARRWEDLGDAEEMMAAWLPDKARYKRTLITPAAAEKIFGPKGTSASVRRWNKLKTLVVQDDPKPSLVPETDSRPAWTPAPKTTTEDFLDLDLPAEGPAKDAPAKNPEDLL